MAYFFINQSSTVFSVVNGITNNVTGDEFLTYLFIMLFVLMLAIAFRIPIEFTAIFFFPMFIVMAAYTGQYLSILGIAMIYLGILIGKNMFFSR